MIELLPNPLFLSWLLASIRRARRSVVLVNYLAAMEEGARKGPVVQVAAALAAACRRGVRVEAVLEGSKFRENMAFYRRLKGAGADVWMDTSRTFIHTKAWLFDGRVLCAGSHNLSASALASHHELSAAIGDRAAIRRFHAELVQMTRQRQEIGAEVCREGARAPVAALVAVKRLIAPHAYLLYLYLCKLDGGRPRPIRVDAGAWAKELGLPATVASANVRISAILDDLDRKLCIVKFDRGRGVVERRAVGGRELQYSGFGIQGSVDGGGQRPATVLIPETFWRFGWHRRLSVEAIHLYLAGESERQASPFAPWWRLRRDEIAARYGFQKQAVNRAQRELRRAGLLEVLFETADAPAGRYVRYMNYFRQNPFYDAAARGRRIAAIAERYPAAVVAVARELLAAVGDDADAEKFAALCGLVAAAGLRRARRVAAAVRRLSPNSTRRTFHYVEEILKG